MIELKYVSIEELNLAYADKFKQLGDRMIKGSKEDKNKFADALILEYNFYFRQIKAKMELNQKFDKLNLKLFESSETIKVRFEARKARYENRRQKALNKKLFKTFKKECKLGIKKSVSDDKLLYETAEKEFNEEQELLKKAKQKAKQLKKPEKKSETKFLEQRRDEDAGTKENS